MKVLRLLCLHVIYLSAAPISYGQSPWAPPTTTWPAIDQFAYFDSFIYDDGTVSGDYWWNVGSTTLANNHTVYAYQDGNGGNSTVECDPVSGTLVLWTITLCGGGGTVYYVDGDASGHLGSFVMQNTAPALNKVININGVNYTAQSGNLLSSAQTEPGYLDYIGAYPDCLWTFTYNGANYSQLSIAYDYSYRTVIQWTGGVTTISSSSDLQQYTEQVAVGLSNGTVAKYIGLNGVDYMYRPNSTAPNALTKINGYNLTASGTKRSLPQTSIQSFVWNGNLYTLDAPAWIKSGQGISSSYTLVDCYSSYTAYYWAGGSQFANGAFCCTSITPSGAFGGINLTDSNSDGLGEDDACLTGGPVNFTQSDVLNASVFTAINNHPYITSGSSVAPLPPITTFTFSGKTYQYLSTISGANNTFVTQYSGPAGLTATMSWSQATNKMVSLVLTNTLNPFLFAKYVNGDAVGQPGTYALSSDSRMGNMLTQVNSTAFTPNGSAALPTGGYVNSNGVFDVQGNFMSLGQWSNDSTHVGFSLSYDDGTPVTTPASVEFTAGRALTTWQWDAATSDGTGVTPSMMLDQNSRLMLYPASTSAVNAPAVPTPSVILDPNGISRFDGPVRISRQGDLSMGEFTTEPTQ